MSRRAEGLAAATLRALPLVRHYVVTRRLPGSRSPEAVREVETPEPFVLTTVFGASDARRDPRSFAVTVQSLVDELASTLVSWCATRGLFRTFDDGPAYAATVALVRVAAVRAVQEPAGPIPGIEHVLDLDPLHAEARALLELRRRRAEEERRARIREQRRRWELRARERRAEERRYLRFLREGGPLTPALDLIRQVTTPREFDELRRRRRVSLRGEAGRTYVVGPLCHDMVECFDARGDLLGRYCLVFRSAWLPPGDEVAMKIAYLKADLSAFLRLATFFPARRARRRARR